MFKFWVTKTLAICAICFTGGITPMHIVYFYIRLYSFYGPCGPEIKLYYYYYYYIIIIIIALKSSGARAPKRNKTKSLIIFKSRGHIGVIISFRGRRLLKVEKQLWRDKFWDFLRKEARLSQYFSVVGSSFQMMGAATEKARLPRFSFVLGI